jgi:hypothetical protein
MPVNEGNPPGRGHRCRTGRAQSRRATHPRCQSRSLPPIGIAHEMGRRFPRWTKEGALAIVREGSRDATLDLLLAHQEQGLFKQDCISAAVRPLQIASSTACHASMRADPRTQGQHGFEDDSINPNHQQWPLVFYRGAEWVGGKSWHTRSIQGKNRLFA